MVCIVRTPDVEQRVPHTIGKIGLIEDVPQHPNTWFRVRIRDGDVVYKYRPSALRLVTATDGGSRDSSRRRSETPARAVRKTSDPRETEEEAGEEDAEEGEQQEQQEEEEEEEEEEAPQDSDAKDIAEENSVEEDAEEHQEDADEEAEEDAEPALDIDTRVRVQLGTLSRRERDLRKYQGKLGVIIAHEADGFKVQLDSEDILTIRSKHLVAAPDAPLAPASDGDQDGEEEEEEDTPTSNGSKLPKGQLLSDLDPDMWIDRKCRINVGKFKGLHGRVLRSGNGWVQLRLENSNENTAKRAYELTLLEDMDTIQALYAKSLAHRREAGDGEEEEEEEEDDVRSGAEDNTTAEQTEDSQGEDNGKRTRRLSTRGSYGISWIEKKVLLPNRKGYGIVKKADRETCTVEIVTSRVLKVFKKKDLELVEEDSTRGGRGSRSRNAAAKAKDRLGLPDGVVLMGTTPARYALFQDQVKKFAMRRREKVKKRPYLLSWKYELEMYQRSSEFRDSQDPSVVDLLVVAQCEICGVEKEEIQGECWNAQCPRSIHFDVEAYDHKTNEERASDIARLPIAPLPNDHITSTLCLKAVADVPRKRKRRHSSSPHAAEGAKSAGDATPPPQRHAKRQYSDESVASIKHDTKKPKKDTKSSKKNATADDKKGKKRPQKSASLDSAGGEGKSR
ncbi:hypothetical protein PINS_up008874 [Pythium insidiosum]|nr:hypothetical protein PINS_up008874 [Pythium insidiosum]